MKKGLATRTVPLWKAAALMLLVLHLLTQMKSSIPESGTPSLSSIRESTINRSTSFMLRMSSSIARNYIYRQLQASHHYRELSHNSYYVIGTDNKRYYHISIRYRIKHSSGEDVINTHCFNFTESGTLIETFSCD
ncbi:hypothetical protein [Telluribacter sp. SYSU D00476]|uniref:hypothetical protein n=1 Tax=Telluribacter sp. SYSU D00476 TaxID=2811430 RepID=UPI001FF4B224|nr:hypothetical protein [Telluribacter sp. SYSU D00476]